MPRPVLAATAVAGSVMALLAAFVVGTSVGGAAAPPAQATTTPSTTPPPGPSCAELLTSYVERGLDLVGPWGWGGGDVRPVVDDLSQDGLAAASGASLSARAPSTARQTHEASGTTVQEAGVDEPDTVKTDGRTLFRVVADTLTTYDVTAAAVTPLGTVALADVDDAELLLAGATVVALGPGGALEEGDRPGTRVVVVDVSDAAHPVVMHTYDYDGEVTAARLSGGAIRLVLGRGLPDLDLVDPGAGPSLSGDREDAERLANEQAVRASGLDDWLPHVSVDGAEPERAVGCGDVTVPTVAASDATPGTTAIIGFDPADPPTSGGSGWSTTALAAGTDIAYASDRRIYLTAAPRVPQADCTVCGAPAPDDRTRLWSFALDPTGPSTTYVAAGEVHGLVRDRWSLDAADGVLRVAVGPSFGAGRDGNAVVTMTEDGGELVELGRVDDLGRGEEIRSVRWFDDLALVVTFRQTDPLYAVDLALPAAPRLIGEVEIPGFSSYLHPLGGLRLLGVGEGPDPGGGRWGAQLGLFDVHDLTAPRRLDVIHYGPGSAALAGVDPRQLTWLPATRTILTVVSRTGRHGVETGSVSVVHLDHGMTSTTVPVETGYDVAGVRLVPLPDGRVVLVTGRGAAFFDPVV